MGYSALDKNGKRYRFRNVLIWAHNGQIALEDTFTGRYELKSRKEIAKLAEAWNKEVSYVLHTDEREELMRCVESLVEVLKEAFNQGDPQLPGVGKIVAKGCRTASLLMDARVRLPGDRALLN